MRIIDVELQNILKQISEADLEKLSQVLEKDSYLLKTSSSYPLYNTDELKKSIAKVVGDDLANKIDDDRAIEDIEDEDEKFYAESERMPFPNGKKNPIRHIPSKEIELLIQREAYMRKGEKFVNSISKLSFDELNELQTNITSRKSPNEAENIAADPKFGVDFYEKYEILDIMKAKAFTKEMVSTIPSKEIKGLKKKFESLRNSPVLSFINDNEAAKHMYKELFGSDKISSNMPYRMYMIDLAEAFDDRDRAIGNKKSGKAGKISIFSALKNALRGQKSRDVEEARGAELRGEQYRGDNGYGR